MCILVCAFSGCATSTQGSSVAEDMSVPQVVVPPDNVPQELQPYESRFEEILTYWGFKVGASTDPHAFQLRLEFSGDPGQAKVAAYLMQDGQAVLTAVAVPNRTVPWHWFSTPEKAELVDQLATNAINQFDQQLDTFTKHIQIVKAPGAATVVAPPAEGGFTAYGTAFAVNSPNTFLTARHVVVGATSIELHCGHDKSGSATVEYNDAGNDVAVLHSDMKADSFLELAPNDSATLGDHVFTIGFPAWNILGTNPKYTEGVVSSLSGIGDSKNLMQITVPIQPGNSGGPLVDSSGHVVGIIVSTAAIPYFYRHTGTLPQNVNYAVPSYYAYPLIRDVPLVGEGALRKMKVIERVTESVCFVAVKGTSRYIQ